MSESIWLTQPRAKDLIAFLVYIHSSISSTQTPHNPTATLITKCTRKPWQKPVIRTNYPSTTLSRSNTKSARTILTAVPCKCLLSFQCESPLTIWRTARNKMTSSLLCLPAELRNEIYKLVSEKFVWIFDCSHKTPVHSTRARVSLLLICLKIKYEVRNMNAESHVLRLGTKAHPFTFCWAVGDSRFRRHAMNNNIHTLEISSNSLRDLSCTYDSSLLGCLVDSAPSKHGWLRVLFPNLKRVELYGYLNLSFDDHYLGDLRKKMVSEAQQTRVWKLCWLVPPTLEPVEEVS